MVLPAGSEVPPPAHLVVLAVAVAAIVWGLRREAVAVTERMVLALAPWMVAGAALYVVYQVGAVPSVVAPFVSSPAVYATTFVLAGATWLLALRTARPLRLLGAVGAVVVLVATAIGVDVGLSRDTFAPVVPLLGVVVAVVLGVGTWLAYRTLRPDDAATVGLAGQVVVFGHVLDGVSTAVGVDLLGFGEQTPLARLVMEAAAGLPTASVVGVGWLFVLVKVGLAVAVLSMLAGYVREEPGEANVLLTFVAAVGLGPGAHNVLLFAVLGPAGF